MTEEQRQEVIRAVRKNLPLAGWRASREKHPLKGAFAYSENPTPIKGTGKRGAMKGSMK